ncbi:DNA integrity scanning diadenylate cyclase DisA [Kocuria rhizophila]|uniref:DNA integrity scanning diadenylate cyclase DisA n=1 Tax=Kocuria rhizophila TaxID=72000 RepID=UPI0011A99AA7|nr:DNA integrity scanning diadenylate cyclase DisA [Kocuria rhizophila]
MVKTRESALRKTLARVAPGTELRTGLERILRGRTGALIVLGFDRSVESLCSGGFDIDAGFTPTKLRELAKMDGAIVCDRDATRILKAGVQLMPDAAITTQESGTRHRSAERTAKQTGVPVISVSASMSVITIYKDEHRYAIEGSQAIMARANQALQTLEHYSNRLEQVLGSLSALEIEAAVTARDVALTLQRMEMVRRISEEISWYVLELGADGRLISLQLEELTAGTGPGPDVVLRDYLPEATDSAAVEAALEALSQLSPAELIDLQRVAAAAGLTGPQGNLETDLHPHGYRLLEGIKSMPGAVAKRLVAQFDGLQSLMAANLEDLMSVEGIGEQRARTVRESLSRMAETSLLDRFM